MKQRTLTMQEAYQQGASQLENAGLPDAHTDAWVLLEFVTGMSKASYFANLQKELCAEMQSQYFLHIARRKERIPVQHITGQQEFMGYMFHVNEHVLIPRQDTETLVEEALKIISPQNSVLDMCTGSGCILLSLIKYAGEKRHIDGLRGTGIDISEQALKIAKENACALNVEVRFVQSDLFENVAETDEKYDLIISNPPYIRTEVIEELQTEVRCHDPYIALDGKEDGLYFYKRIISDSIRFIKNGGWLMFEIGFDQGKDVAALMEQAGYKEVYIKKDLAGLDRVVSGMYNRP